MNRLISLGVLSVAFVLPAAAQADPGNGAQVTIVHQCDTGEFGTVCIDDHAVSNIRTTPSGNNVQVVNLRGDVSFVGANGACSFEQSVQEHFHAVLGPNANESSVLRRGEFRFPTGCTGGNIIVCETVMHFHQVNGVAQFQRSIAECTEEPAP